MRAPVRVIKPKVTQAAARHEVPGGPDRRPRTTSSSGSTSTCSWRRATRSPSARVGFDTPAGLYHIQNKAVDPAWHVPNSAWAGDLAGTVDPRRRARQPAQGALARHLQRRRHPRHRRDLLAGPRRLPRLHPDGDPGRDRALRPGPGRRADLHRLGVRPARSFVDRRLPPNPAPASRFRRSVCRMQRVPMKMPAFPLAQHRVPHRRGVARALDRVPGRDGLLVLVREPGLDELSPRRHPPVLRVDEEDTHSGRG